MYFFDSDKVCVPGSPERRAEAPGVCEFSRPNVVSAVRLWCIDQCLLSPTTSACDAFRSSVEKTCCHIHLAFCCAPPPYFSHTHTLTHFCTICRQRGDVYNNAYKQSKIKVWIFISQCQVKLINKPHGY